VFSAMSEIIVACCEEEFLVIVGENEAISIEAFFVEPRDRSGHLTYVFLNSEAGDRLERWAH
jgi:hypothetical protein